MMYNNLILDISLFMIEILLNGKIDGERDLYKYNRESRESICKITERLRKRHTRQADEEVVVAELGERVTHLFGVNFVAAPPMAKGRKRMPKA